VRANGKLYGTAGAGGAFGCGVAWEIARVTVSALRSSSSALSEPPIEPLQSS
jgi:hypothetical protein